jgi:hypothetical protein
MLRGLQKAGNRVTILMLEGRSVKLIEISISQLTEKRPWSHGHEAFLMV